MPTMGYNVIEPNGHVCKLRAETDEERRQIVSQLLEKWGDYCSANWVSVNSEDPYSAENRVKTFLNSLGYFLMLGDQRARGIVTDYKKVEDGKREIPISSCPPYVESSLYGLGVGGMKEDDTTSAASTALPLSSISKRRRGKGSGKRKKAGSSSGRKATRFDKVQAIKRRAKAFEYGTVDTENQFTAFGKRWRISPQVAEYRMKLTDAGALYDMDKVMAVQVMDKSGSGTCGIEFYDMNVKKIPKRLVEEVTA